MVLAEGKEFDLEQVGSTIKSSMWSKTGRPESIFLLLPTTVSGQGNKNVWKRSTHQNNMGHSLLINTFYSLNEKPI